MRTRAMMLAVTLLCMSLPASAQVMVAAVVPVASPAGSGTRNLTFGTVTPIPGTTQTIDVVADVAPVSGTVQSGEFSYNVAGTRGLDFSLSMPMQLTMPGATPLAVTSSGAQYGGYCVTATASCTLTSFNPGSGQNVRVCRSLLLIWCNPFAGGYPGGSVLRVYVGGSLSVPPIAHAGVYVGTVTLTIVQVF